MLRGFIIHFVNYLYTEYILFTQHSDDCHNTDPKMSVNNNNNNNVTEIIYKCTFFG